MCCRQGLQQPHTSDEVALPNKCAFMNGDYLEEFKYKTCFIIHVCSYVVAMPSVRNCSINGHEIERKDSKFIGRVQTSDYAT